MKRNAVTRKRSLVLLALTAVAAVVLVVVLNAGAASSPAGITALSCAQSSTRVS
jgi:hypothetical protein